MESNCTGGLIARHNIFRRKRTALLEPRQYDCRHGGSDERCHCVSVFQTCLVGLRLTLPSLDLALEVQVERKWEADCEHLGGRKPV